MFLCAPIGWKLHCKFRIVSFSPTFIVISWKLWNVLNETMMRGRVFLAHIILEKARSMHFDFFSSIPWFGTLSYLIGCNFFDGRRKRRMWWRLNQMESLNQAGLLDMLVKDNNGLVVEVCAQVQGVMCANMVDACAIIALDWCFDDVVI